VVCICPAVLGSDVRNIRQASLLHSTITASARLRCTRCTRSLHCSCPAILARMERRTHPKGLPTTVVSDWKGGGTEPPTRVSMYIEGFPPKIPGFPALPGRQTDCFGTQSTFLFVGVVQWCAAVNKAPVRGTVYGVATKQREKDASLCLPCNFSVLGEVGRGGALGTTRRARLRDSMASEIGTALQF
jgi:hypothetical protein